MKWIGIIGMIRDKTPCIVLISHHSCYLFSCLSFTRVSSLSLEKGQRENSIIISILLIRAGEIVEEGLLNRIEMAFRLYDPCLSCATHAIGTTPLILTIRTPRGAVLRTIRRDG